MKLTVVGCSPAWPNPGGAQSGYLVESAERRLLLDCGPGVLPRLRAREGWPVVDAIAITHFHLDHWGDLVPWVWGLQFGPAADLAAARALAATGRTRDARAARRGARAARHVRDARSSIEEYERRRRRSTRRARRVTPRRVLHYDMLAFGFRVSDERDDARVLRRQRPERRAGGARARRRPLPLRGDAARAEPRRRHARPPRRRGGRRGVPRVGREAACCSRTVPRSGRSRTGFEQVYDGFELELVAERLGVAARRAPAADGTLREPPTKRARREQAAEERRPAASSHRAESVACERRRRRAGAARSGSALPPPPMPFGTQDATSQRCGWLG